MTPTSHGDLIDGLLGLGPDSSTYQARHFREKARKGTQDAYDTLFAPDLALPVQSRWLAALYACRLSHAHALAEHYRQQALAAGVERSLIDDIETGDLSAIAEAQLRAILAFTKKLIERPIEGDEAALRTLADAGLSTKEIIILAQLIGFLSYQIRLVAGLAAMHSAEEK